MKVIVFGATGRVGKSAVEQALATKHEVTAFVRDPAKLGLSHERLRVAVGDIKKPETVRAAIVGQDAVVMAVGADVMKPSTIVQDSVRAILDGMAAAGVRRYLGVSGTIALEQSALGRATVWLMRHSPIRYGVEDHFVALELVRASDLDYALAACPHIRDGKLTGAYKEVTGAFHGGYRYISPEDVAHFFVKELNQARHHRQAVGIWM